MTLARSPLTRCRKRHGVALVVATALVIVGGCGTGTMDALIPGQSVAVFGV